MNNTLNMPNEAQKRTAIARVGGAIGAGFTGLFAVPVLGTLAVSFAAIGAGLPVLSILNLVGLTHIPFNVLFLQITGVPQVFAALVAGAIFIALGALCFLGLKRFFAFSRWLTR